MNLSGLDDTAKTGDFHDSSTCNKCGGRNDETPTDIVAYQVSECETVCRDCGFEDYWAYGFFESSDRGYDSCKKY